MGAWNQRATTRTRFLTGDMDGAMAVSTTADLNNALMEATIARPALTSASAPFSMTRRFPLPARRSFASIDRVMGSISGLWLPPPASSAAAIFRPSRESEQPSSDPRLAFEHGLKHWDSHYFT